MPGISGIIGAAARAGSEPAVALMLERMSHERFYTSGSLADRTRSFCVGWVSAEGTFSDCLPIWNEKRDVCLLFSGEEFSSSDVISELKAKGHVFEDGNGSYLVHLYEEHGPSFLEGLNGCFCGLLLDLRSQETILFNDRYGVGRVYFSEKQEGFYFASEAKSLLKILPETRKLDLQAFGELWSCNCVLQNRSAFSGVNLLPPGSAWSFAPGRPVQKRRYFDPQTWEAQSSLPPEEYYQAFKETWRRILPRYFRGSDTVGLSLTGGVDSRMIMAWAPQGGRSLPCYTFGGRYRDCADVELARKIARICGQEHQTIRVAEEFLSQFPRLAEQSVYISDGTMDVLGSIDLYIQRIAREIAPVRVTGTNGGEILRSLVAFHPGVAGTSLLQPEFAQSVDSAAGRYAQELNGRPLSFTAFKQAPWYMGSKFVLERSQLTLRMPYFDNDLVSLVYRAPAEFAGSNDFSLRMIRDGNPALGKMATDRAGSGDSVPGLSHLRKLLGEFSFKVEHAYDSGMPQWFAALNHAVPPLRLERLFLGRHKFHHFRVWYRDELAKFVKETLLDARSLNRSCFNRKRLEEIVTDHVTGRRNYTGEIHKALSMELLHRHLIEQN